jgi:hypothetical protein
MAVLPTQLITVIIIGCIAIIFLIGFYVIMICLWKRQPSSIDEADIHLDSIPTRNNN